MSQQVPASNPGSDDPSAGIATGSGGVSSAAYVLSPVPTEQKSVVQATVDTVKSYLPSLGSLSLGGGGAKAEDSDTKNNEGEEKSAVGAAAGGAAAAAAAAAVAVGLKSDGAAPTDSADPNASSTSKDEPMTDSSLKDETTKTDTANEVREAKDESKSADTGPTDRANEESTAKTDTEGAQPGEGGGGSEETGGGSDSKKTPTGKENREAIPTAGGERLGDKHWGESKVVPDVPKKQEETPQVSSEEGQPDSMSSSLDGSFIRMELT